MSATAPSFADGRGLGLVELSSGSPEAVGVAVDEPLLFVVEAVDGDEAEEDEDEMDSETDD